MQPMDEIYQQYARMVYRYLLRMTRDENLAEELTQETFYQAIRTSGFERVQLIAQRSKVGAHHGRKEELFVVGHDRTFLRNRLTDARIAGIQRHVNRLTSTPHLLHNRLTSSS